MTEQALPTADLEDTDIGPARSLTAALGWRDILESRFGLRCHCNEKSDPADLRSPSLPEAAKVQALHYSLRIKTQRSPLPGEIIALRKADGTQLLGFVAKTQRLCDGWSLAIEIVSRGYKALKARTAGAMWPDGNRDTADVIDFYPADRPNGQKSLLIKASRTSSLALCMPWAIELEGQRWVRASKPQHNGHIVAVN